MGRVVARKRTPQSAGAGEADSGRVQLCLLQPWRQAVNCFFPGEDDDPDIDDLVWRTPRTYAAGDTMVYLVDAPSPAIIKIDTLSRSSEDDGLNAEPDSEWGPFDQGLSLRAIEKRLGDTLPEAPVTITDDTLGQQFLAAIEAEEAHPTPWREVDDSWCRWHPADAPPGAPFGPADCVGCGRQFTPDLPAESHQRNVGDDEDPAFADGSPVAVCSDCHDRLHQPLPVSLADLICARRPLCPSCSAERTLEVIWGMPGGPPGPGVALAGCVITGPTLEYRCAACGYEWSDDDTAYPAAHGAGGGDRVRARLSDYPPGDLPPSRRQQPGRLVVGRYHPHHVDGAWESGTRHLIIGEDHKHYIVDPTTLRWADHTTDADLSRSLD